MSSGKIAELKNIDMLISKLPSHAYNTPIKLAWHAFCETADESIREQLARPGSVETKFPSFEGLQFIFELRIRELFNDPQTTALKSAFSNILCCWLSAMCSIFRLKSLPSYSEVIPFTMDLLQDSQNLSLFWDQDLPAKNRLYKVLGEMQAYFPYQTVDVMNLLITLCGNDEFQYADRVVQYLKNMTGYTHIFYNQELAMEALRPSDNSDRTEEKTYISKEVVVIKGITIPINTKATIIEKRRPNNLLLRWDITYSAWPILFFKAEEILASEIVDSESFECLTTFIRLICKIIELNPVQASYIEGLSLPANTNDETRGRMDITFTTAIKILSLFGKGLQYMAQQVGENCLVVAQSIVDAICKLYQTDEMKGEVVRFIENASKLYAEAHYSAHGQLHPLVLLFKSFKEHENSLRSTQFSQAALHLAITLLADPYLSENFSGSQSSCFITDFLQFIFDEIIRNFDGFEGRDMCDSLSLMKGVMHLIYVIMLKYRSSPTKLQFDYGTKKNQPLISFLTHMLNRAQVSQILLKVMRVKLTYKDAQANSDRNEYAALLIQNRYWSELLITGKFGDKEKKILRKSIALCLSTVAMVLGMVHQQRLWILQAKKEERANYEYFQDLSIVGEFYNYFYDRAELPTFYEESSRSIERTPINFVLAITSYISFESDNGLQVDPSPQGSPDTLLPPKSFSYNVNQNAVICLTKLFLIWEQYPSISRPSLIGYLDYSKSELYGQSEYTFGKVHSELDCIQKLRSELYSLLSSYMYSPELSSLVLELLMVAICSQRSFCELMIKSETEKYLKDRDFVSVMCKSLAERNIVSDEDKNITKVYGYWIILLSTLLENESGNESLIRKLRQHNLYSSALVEAHRAVLNIFIPSNSATNANVRIRSYANESNKSFGLTEILRSNHLLEELVRDECFNLYVQLSYIGILVREVIRNDYDIADALKNLLEEFFEKASPAVFDRIFRDGLNLNTWKTCSDEYEMMKRYQPGEFLKRIDKIAPMGDVRGPMLNSSYTDFNSAIYAWTLSPSIGSGSITKWMWNILAGANDYGYGKNWCIDILELWTEAKSVFPIESCQSIVWAMSKYNLETSLQDVENKYIIFYNQLMTLLIVEGVKDDMIVEPVAQAMSSYVERQNWEDVIRRCIQLTNSLWDSLRVKIPEEVLTPLDVYKLQQKLSALALGYNGLSFAYKKIYDKRDRNADTTRSEEFRRMVEMQLVDAIPELKDLLKKNVLGSYLKYNNEQILTSFNIQLVAFIQFMSDSQIDLNKQKEIGLLNLVQPLGEELEIVIRISFNSPKQSVNFLPLVVSALEQIVRIINDEIYVNIFGIERSKLIKLLLNRLISPSCTQSDFLAILKFFIAYSSKVKGANHLYEEKIIQTLCMIPSFKDIVNLNEYEEDQRSNGHILWCWTLFLLRCLFSTSSTVPGFFGTALSFLSCFEGRILKTLRFQGYIDSNNRPMRYTLAYVEELEYTMGLLTQYMIQHDKWRYENNNQFEEFMETIFKFTIKVYSSNVVLTDSYIPVSEPEKQSSQLFAKDLLTSPSKSLLGSINSIPKILTSVRSPTKDEYFKPHDSPGKSRRRLSHASSNESDKYVQGYNPNIFHMRVEISLNKTLLYALSGLIEPLSMEIQEIESSFSGRMKEYSAAYGSRWNEDLFKLTDCALFGVHSYEKCIVNYKELEPLLKRMNFIYSSVDASVKYGTLNHLHIVNMDELLNIIETHMEMCFYSIILYLQGNEIRNKQFSPSVVSYLSRIMDQKTTRMRMPEINANREWGKNSMEDNDGGKEQGFLKWLIEYFTTNA